MSRKLPGSAIVPGTITVTQITGGLNDTTNASYAQANTARTTANDAYGQANTARDQANTARTQANTAYGQANNAYSSANLAYDQANASYNVANTKLASAGGTLSGDLIITGNLTVSGNSTTLNTEILTVEDAEVVLLSNVASTPALNAGVIVNRGTSANTFLRWDEALDEWGWSDSGTTTYYFDDLRAGLATTNTTFGTINTSLGTINTSYQAAYAQANTAGTNALNAYGQANAAYGAANNRVLKTGDTMTGQLNISAGGLLVTGNLGIGTTSPAYKLDVNGNTRIKGVGSYLYFDTTSSDASAWIRVRDDYILSLWNNRGSRSELRLGNEHVQFFTNNDTEQMRITSGGNVGIGTTSPQSKLEVATSSNNFSHFGATSTANGQFTGITLGYRENNSSYRKAAIVQEQIGDNSARGHLHLLVDIANDEGSAVLGDSKLMIHGTTGNVGIGTTNPATKLEVVGTISYKPSVGTSLTLGDDGTYGTSGTGRYTTLGFSGNNNGGNRIFAHNTGEDGLYICSATSRGIAFRVNGGGTNNVLIDSSGNVGIGTTNPPRRLSINALGTGNYEMVVGWSGSSLSQNATLDVITTHDSYGFQVWDDNNLTTPRFLVARGGNVGIGTQTPLAKLDVVGDTYVRSGTFFTDTIRPYSGQQLTVLNGGSNSLYINGKVGIGTATPAYKQDVEGISYNRGEIIRPSVYGGDNSGTNHIIGSYILGAGKYWTVTSGAKYVHILLPARYNANNGASLMWCIEVKGYDFNAARIINLMIGGYVTPVSNGGPMSQVAVWDSAGSGVYSPTAYFSSNYNRGVARFYLSSAYYASFTINTIASGNGDVIAPDELTIIESVNATI